jgi:signal transduction histidine kinase
LSAVVSDGQREWFLVNNGAYRIERGRWEPLRDRAGMPVEVLGAAVFVEPSEFWAVDKLGVAVYRLADGIATLVRHLDASLLGTADIEFLGVDRDQHVWVGTDRGAFVRLGNRWLLLDRGNGLLWNDLDDGAVYFERDGGVWIGSSKGATHVLPGQLGIDAAKLLVEEVRFGDRPATRIVPKNVDWADRRMRLTLQTPQIGRGRSMHLEYRLNDAVAWDAFTGNVLQLESLEPGEYRLQVRAAADAPLLQPGAPVDLSFDIHPPWWLSAPARIGYVAALAGAWLLSMQLLRVRARTMQAALERAISERTIELERSRKLVRDLGVHNTKLLEEERKRVARELHDEMGQQLAALRMEISVLRRRAPSTGSAADEAALEMLLARVEDLVASMRSVVAELRPPALDGGLAAALDWLVATFERHAGIPCDAEVDDSAELLSPDAAVMVFRIAQESLNNVRRHARARRASLRLCRTGAYCVLTIGDDGVGFDPSSRADGYGILGMEERALALGGALNVVSVVGQGSTVRLQMPLPGVREASC